MPALAPRRRALTIAVAALALAAGALGAPGASAAPVVLWIQGQVTVAPLGADGRPGPPLLLDTMDPLTPGERLSIPEGARAWVLLGGGKLWSFTGPGAFQVADDGLLGVGDAGEATVDAIEGLDLSRAGPAMVWDGDPDRAAEAVVQIVSPRETAVRDGRPTLRWALPTASPDALEPPDLVSEKNPPPGADRYDVSLWRLEVDGSLALVEEWRGLQGRTHRPWYALSQGYYHLWRVRVRGVDPDAGGEASAWFRVMTEAEQTTASVALDKLGLESVRRAGAGAALAVARALVLEHHGLLGAAERQWRELTVIRPGSEAIGRRLLRLAQRALVTPRTRVAPILPFGSAVEGGDVVP